MRGHDAGAYGARAVGAGRRFLRCRQRVSVCEFDNGMGMEAGCSRLVVVRAWTGSLRIVYCNQGYFDEII